MKAAFVDTSALTAILFKEQDASAICGILSNLEGVYASHLLEAEMRSAAARENLDQQAVDAALSEVKWVLPDRSLTMEIKTILSVGPEGTRKAGMPLRGADLWHVACALYLAGDPSALPFVTLDEDQAQAAARLGFKVLPEPLATGSVIQEPRGPYRSCPEPRRMGAVYRSGKPKKRHRK